MVRGLAGLIYMAGVAGVAGCYAPNPQAGSPCPDGICPSGLVCAAATMTCETSDHDAGADAPPPPADTLPAGCYGNGVVTVCPVNPITGQQQITLTNTQTINTDTSTMCQPYRRADGTSASDFCVLAAKSITISQTGRLNGIGSKPLVLVGANMLDLAGTLDVASHRGGLVGAGADPVACPTVAAPTGSKGGPGGSFGEEGGDGGTGAEGGLPVPPGPFAGAVTTLRGGCRGLAGAGLQPGAGGRGGGAVYLISTDMITIAGTINASGAGSSGANLNGGGGGGGGAGGMIGLDAPTIVVSLTARVFANGGGGGEGAAGNPGNGGDDPASPTIPALGGAGGAGNGGDGGDGGDAVHDPRNGSGDAVSGGGGGGGVGVIQVFPPRTLTGSISPPPS